MIRDAHSDAAMTAPRPLTVTRPDLPPLDEFLPYLREIWDTRVLSNGGPFHQRLEAALCALPGSGPHLRSSPTRRSRW